MVNLSVDMCADMLKRMLVCEVTCALTFPAASAAGGGISRSNSNVRGRIVNALTPAGKRWVTEDGDLAELGSVSSLRSLRLEQSHRPTKRERTCMDMCVGQLYAAMCADSCCHVSVPCVQRVFSCRFLVQRLCVNPCTKMCEGACAGMSILTRVRT